MPDIGIAVTWSPRAADPMAFRHSSANMQPLLPCYNSRAWLDVAKWCAWHQTNWPSTRYM